MIEKKSNYSSRKYLKADLHVHSYFSGKTNHVKLLEPMDSYSSPETIYCLAKKRGMDLVTITDHDSIDGCLHLLNKCPEKVNDFIIGEEITTRLPKFNAKIHIGVYDITEEQHREITRLKKNFSELIEYLRAENIIYVLNHLFFNFPKNKCAQTFIECMLNSFDVFEGWNGALGKQQNILVSKLLEINPEKILVAGSDSHTLLRLGTSYTMAAGENKREFLESIRKGRVSIQGKNGKFFHVFNDAMGVYLAYFRDIAFRNEVHRNWSKFKKVRNGVGWAFYLPVFFSLSFAYTFLIYRLEEHRYPYYQRVLREIGRIEQVETISKNAF